MIAMFWILSCFFAQTTGAPLLPPLPVTGYERVPKKSVPVKLKKKRKKKFGMEMGVNYDYSRLGGSDFHGVAWNLGFFKPQSFGFSYGIAYAFEEGTKRWDIRFKVGLSYNWSQSRDLMYFAHMGYSFDMISLPLEYITSQKDQVQHGWYGSVGLRYRLAGSLFLYGEGAFMDYYAFAEPGSRGIIPNQRGFSVAAGLSYIFML
ncbi:hypothetical protein KKF84_09105 [Myxococcota bacterium]|nr:hypothetical protein [Myxococcota bacterium]MBU1535467.1 hypothetical protein [Myxococcota bacterium]